MTELEGWKIGKRNFHPSFRPAFPISPPKLLLLDWQIQQIHVAERKGLEGVRRYTLPIFHIFLIMRRYFKLYSLLAGAYVRSRLQYRLSFGFMCFGIVISEVCLLGLLGALLAKFRTVNGWTWAEVVFLYGLGNLAYSLMRILGSQLDDFDRYIVRGELDGVLIKPVPPLFYILASRVELVHISRALTSVVIFVIAFHLTGIRWTVEVALFTLTTILSGTLIMLTLMLVSATVALWTTKSGKLTDLLISATKEATAFPISIYPLAVQLLLTFILPVAFVTYYPAQQLLQKGEFLGMPESFQFGAPVVALAMVCISYLFWYSGLRRYHSTGS